MNVDDIVAQKIAAARARAEAAKRRRAVFAAARQRGLAARHAQKLARLRTQESNAAVTETDTVGPNRVDIDTVANVDDVVVEVTEAEFYAAVRTSLARLGLTYAELEDQARRRDFTSAQAQVLWVSIGGTVNPELLKEDQ
ncbi:hypothetical protein AB0N92_04080 [Streptomyces sp. NPDC093248]|uniref:hypothetical protein n=1 Tax=Streptomyces sp. NPDC093248 TaxID=3155072 RepID=UPI00341A1B07